MFSNRKSTTASTHKQGADANGREPVRVMLIGSEPGISFIIKTLYRLGFADIKEWGIPQPYPNSDKSMSILTRWRQD